MCVLHPSSSFKCARRHSARAVTNSPLSDQREEPQMKALVYHGPGERGWDTVDDPTILDPTDAIVRIDTSTICGTDLHILKGDVPETTPGTVLGHEAVGTVAGGGCRREHGLPRRPGADVVRQLVRALSLLQRRPLRAVPGRRRLDLRAPDQWAAGRIRARALRR